MQIEIKIDERCKTPRIIIMTDKMTEEINGLLKQLSDQPSVTMAGFRNDIVEILDPVNVYRIFAANGKVLAETESGEYVLRLRLYEAEQQLGGFSFVRISNSEIINLKKVKNFDLSFVGTIYVSLTNGASTYVSRRYVAKIKQVLGM